MLNSNISTLKQARVCNVIDIINGQKITESEYPSTVRIGGYNNNRQMFMCSATFVSPSTMITAAHCTEFFGEWAKEFVLKRDP